MIESDGLIADTLFKQLFTEVHEGFGSIVAVGVETLVVAELVVVFGNLWRLLDDKIHSRNVSCLVLLSQGVVIGIIHCDMIFIVDKWLSGELTRLF